MTVRAFVLIETEVGKTRDVVEALRSQGAKGIKSVDLVTGPYDIIVLIEHDDFDAMSSLITDEIHPTLGMGRTVTCLSIRVQ